MAMNRTVHVHIDELRLVGIGERRPDALRAALREELTHLLGPGGVVDTWTESRQVDRITGAVPAGRSGAARGRAAARSLVDGLQHEPTRPSHEYPTAAGDEAGS